MKKMLPSLLFALAMVWLISGCSDPFSAEPDFQASADEVSESDTT